MKVLITGTSQGIGKAIAQRFLDEGHSVIGIDRQDNSIRHSEYTHHVCDLRDRESLPREAVYPCYWGIFGNQINGVPSVRCAVFIAVLL